MAFSLGVLAVRMSGLAVALMLPLLPLLALAQSAPTVGAGNGPLADARPDFRDVSGYRFPPPAQTVRDMQNLAQAIQLRDYCADARISDEFVKERLAMFSRITGRPETCRSLLDY